MWTKPSYTEMRFGFEVTMYIMNRVFPLTTSRSFTV
jgi:coenzyme PQQ precursor peptide PqqA